MTQVRTFERVRSLTPLIPDMLRSSFLLAEAAMALTSEHTSLESSVLEITLTRHGAPEHWKKTMRAEVCSSIQGTKSKDEKDRGGHCKKLWWTPQNACLGIVAVDTAKNAEDGMVRMGRMGVACLGSGGGHRKAHEDARNQQQSSFHGHNCRTRLQSFRLKIASSLTSSSVGCHLTHARNGIGTHLAVDTAAKGIWRLTPLLHTRRLKPRAIT